MSDIVPKFKKLVQKGAPFTPDEEYYKTLKNYEQVDAHARSAPANIPTLTETVKYLCTPFHTKEEKARAIYVWLCLNLSYDVVNRKAHTLPKYNPEVMDSSFSEEERKTYDQFGLCAFYLKTCVCTGYAGLFEGMCKQAGIENVFRIAGKGRGPEVDPNDPFNFTPDHEYNAVEIDDGTLRLVDVTYGSGVAGAAAEMSTGPVEKVCKSRYFLMSPNEFISGHWPKDPAWQLLDPQITQEEYPTSLNYSFAAMEMNVHPLTHKKSIIELSESNFIKVELAVNAGLYWSVNLIEKATGEKSKTLSVNNIPINHTTDRIVIEASVPKAETIYELRILAGSLEGGNKTVDGVFSYYVKVLPGAKMVEDTFPTEYVPWQNYRAELISPHTGKLKTGVQVDKTLLTNKGDGLYESSVMLTEPGKVKIWAWKGTNSECLMSFEVEGEKIDRPVFLKDWNDAAGELIAPTTGSIKINEPVNIKIQFPATTTIDTIRFNHAMFKPTSPGLFEFTTTPTAAGQLALFAGVGTALVAHMIFNVVQ